MTDYRVVHIAVAAGEARGEVSARIEKECNNAAREGWRLEDVAPDTAGGATSGLWLIFASGDEGVPDTPLVAEATEIVSQAAGEEPAAPGV